MVYSIMISFMQKTLAQVNEKVHKGESVIVTGVSVQEEPTDTTPENVDVVTTATFAKNTYLPLMPVLVPPQQCKK